MTVDNRRVVVTGMGAITPLGNTLDESWEALCKGVSGIDALTRFDASAFPTRIAAEVKGFEPEQYVGKKDSKKMHIPSNLVVDQWASDGESRSHRDFMFLYDV